MPELQHRLTRLSHWLGARAATWRSAPFRVERVDIEDSAPEIVRWLLALDESELDRFEAEPALLEAAPNPLGRWAREGRDLTVLPMLSGEPVELGAHFSRAVPGRKRAQVAAWLGRVLPALGPAERYVDWCGGKAHLGRAIALHSALPVDVYERNHGLMRKGAERALSVGAQLHFHEVDLDRGLPAVRGPISALHACGGLSDGALQAAVEAGVAAAVAPCCYHRLRPHQDGWRYTPQSATGRAGDLGLDGLILRFITADEVVASAADRRRRSQEIAWRSALDRLRRQATGARGYGTQRGVPRRAFASGFEDFLKEGAHALGFAIPRGLDLGAVEAAAWVAAHRARALGLARLPFQRALELWLNLDRAVALNERGRDVRLALFCARRDSPRNMVLLLRP